MNSKTKVRIRLSHGGVVEAYATDEPGKYQLNEHQFIYNVAPSQIEPAVEFPVIKPSDPATSYADAWSFASGAFYTSTEFSCPVCGTLIKDPLSALEMYTIPDSLLIFAKSLKLSPQLCRLKACGCRVLALWTDKFFKEVSYRVMGGKPRPIPKFAPSEVNEHSSKLSSILVSLHASRGDQAATALQKEKLDFLICAAQDSLCLLQGYTSPSQINKNFFDQMKTWAQKLDERDKMELKKVQLQALAPSLVEKPLEVPKVNEARIRLLVRALLHVLLRQTGFLAGLLLNHHTKPLNKYGIAQDAFLRKVDANLKAWLGGGILMLPESSELLSIYAECIDFANKTRIEFSDGGKTVIFTEEGNTTPTAGPVLLPSPEELAEQQEKVRRAAELEQRREFLRSLGRKPRKVGISLKKTNN